MTKPPTVYDLMLVLSATAEEERRAQASLRRSTR